MKYNLGIFHKPDAHTSTRLHTLWKERRAAEEKREKFPRLFDLGWLVGILRVLFVN